MCPSDLSATNGKVSIGIERKNLSGYSQIFLENTSVTANEVYSGSVVKVMMKPDTGYRRSEVTVTINDVPVNASKYSIGGNELTLNVDSTFSNGATIVVAPTFEEIGSKYTFSVNDPENNATISCVNSNGDDFTSGSNLLEADTLVFTLSNKIGIAHV